MEHPPRHLNASLKSPLLVVRIEPGHGSWRRMVGTVRHFLLRRLEKGLAMGGAPAAARALARAMLLGDRSRLAADDWHRLQEGGAIHVLAISGLHITLLVGLFSTLLRRLGTGQPLRFLGQGFFLAFYISLIPAGPAPLRASVMGLVGAGSQICGRKTRPLSLLGLVALAFLVQRPSLATEAGFCLSYTVTGFLAGRSMTRSRPVSEGRYRSWLTALLRTNLIATASSLPLTAYYFGRCVPASVLVNLVAVPAAMVMVCLAAAATLLAVVHPHLAAPLARPLAWAAHLLLSAPLAATSLPLGTMAVPRSRGLLVVAALATLALALSRRFAPRRQVWIAVLLTQMLLLTHLLPPQPLPRGSLSLRAMDVGQGDALLVGLPSGEALLVDGGGRRHDGGATGRQVLLPALHDAGLTRLVAVVLTHSHIDHGGGLRRVLQDFPVDELWLPSLTPGDFLAGDLVDRGVARGIAVRTLSRGEHLNRGGVRILCLNPSPERKRASPNQQSVVLQLEGAAGGLLLTGDLDGEGERELLLGNQLAPVQVLKVAHHGSRNSTSAAFLSRVSPQVALISVGARNAWGHPDSTVLARLHAAGAQVLRTDLQGAVTVTLASPTPRVTTIRALHP